MAKDGSLDPNKLVLKVPGKKSRDCQNVPDADSVMSESDSAGTTRSKNSFLSSLNPLSGKRKATSQPTGYSPQKQRIRTNGDRQKSAPPASTDSNAPSGLVTTTARPAPTEYDDHSMDDNTDIISMNNTEYEGKLLDRTELTANLIDHYQSIASLYKRLVTSGNHDILLDPEVRSYAEAANLGSSITVEPMISQIEFLAQLVTNTLSGVEECKREIAKAQQKWTNTEDKIGKIEERILTTQTGNYKATQAKLTDIAHQMEENERRITKRLDWIEEAVKKTPVVQAISSNPKPKATTPTLSPNSQPPQTKTTPPLPALDTKKTTTTITNSYTVDPTKAHHPSRAVFTFQGGIPADEQHAPEEICRRLNECLSKLPSPAKSLRVVAARYNQHGNIVVNTRADQNAEDLIKHTNVLLPLLHPTRTGSARPDKKWFKIQVDGIPTRRFTAGMEHHTHTSEEIHDQFTDLNPAYANNMEHIAAIPRWLRTEDELRKAAHSSVVVAFSDENAAKSILRVGKLAAFGRFCTLRPFQDRPPVIQCTNCWGWDHVKDKCQYETRCRYCSEAHSEKDHVSGPCERCAQIAADNGDIITDDNCIHKLKCSNCALNGHEDFHHEADNRRCPSRLLKWGSARDNERKAMRSEHPWKVPKPKPVRRQKSKANLDSITSNTDNRFAPLTILDNESNQTNNTNTNPTQ